MKVKNNNAMNILPMFYLNHLNKTKDNMIYVQRLIQEMTESPTAAAVVTVATSREISAAVGCGGAQATWA